MLKIITFLILLGGLTGCGFALDPLSGPYSITCDSTCDKTPIVKAINEWDSTQNRNIFYWEEGDIADVTISIVDYLPCDGVPACSLHDSGLILINIDAFNWAVVAHELGHKLGFNHSDNLNDLMYPAPSALNPLFPNI